MSMEIAGLKQAIEKIGILNEAHIASFDSKLLPDLNAQTRERTREFSKMKESVDKLIREMTEMKDENIIQQVREIVPAVQELVMQNKCLESRIREHKNRLEGSMKRVNHGKKAIHGYGAAASMGQCSNKVIAITNR